VKYYIRKPGKPSFSYSLLSAFGSAVGWIYKLAFGGFDEFFYRRSRQRFIVEINRNFDYLFSEHHGSVSLHEGENYPRAFDYVCVVLEFDAMRIRIIRGRGELDVEVAPAREPGDWRELCFLRQVMDQSGRNEIPSMPRSLDELAGQVQECWSQLTELMSEENWFPSLTLAEWRRFIRLPLREKLEIRESMAPRLSKPAPNNSFASRF
jgi:hypothetical protein